MSLEHEEKDEFAQYLDEGENHWTCTFCRSSFVNRARCVQHLGCVHKVGASWNCQECGKMFFHKYKLKMHMKCHNKIRDIICDLCGKGFSDNAPLKRHRLKIHGSEQEKEEERKFACTTCGKKFYRQCILTAHEFIHLDYNSFFCDQCECGYKTQNGLRIHINKVHNGKYGLTEEKRKELNVKRNKRRADNKVKNGGNYRTPEERVKFNEYMREYQARKRLQKAGAKPGHLEPGTALGSNVVS